MGYGSRAVFLSFMLSLLFPLPSNAQQNPPGGSPNSSQIKQLRQEMVLLRQQLEPLRSQLQQLLTQTRNLRTQMRPIEDRMKSDLDQIRTLGGR